MGNVEHGLARHGFRNQKPLTDKVLEDAFARRRHPSPGRRTTCELAVIAYLD